MFVYAGLKSFFYSNPVQSKLLKELNTSINLVQKNLARCEFIMDADWALQHITIHDQAKDLPADYAGFSIYNSEQLIKKIEWCQERALKMCPALEGQPGLFRNVDCAKDIEKSICTYLDIKSLIAMRHVSPANRIIVDELVNQLIKDLNAKRVTPRDLGISSLSALIGLLGEKCSEVSCLDLRGLEIKDMSKICSFTQITDLFVNKCDVSDVFRNYFITDYFKNFPLLENITWEECKIYNDSPFTLEPFIPPTLKNVDLSRCKDTVSRLDSLIDCPSVETLSLAGCKFMNFVKCPSLKELNLAGSTHHDLLGIVKLCPSLEELDISKKYTPKTYAIKSRDYVDMSPTANIEKEITKEFENQSNLDLSFLQHMPPLHALNLGNLAPVAVEERPDVDLMSLSEACPTLKTIIAKDLKVDEYDLESVRKKGVNVIL